MRLKQKTAIVTGASSGIGQAIALEFAWQGANVVVADTQRSPREGGPNTMDVLKSFDNTTEFHTADVSSWDGIDQLVSKTIEQFGRLDIMVNNAATHSGTKLTETSEEQWDSVMAVNLKGVFLGCKRAVQQMLTQDIVNEARGRIINIASQHGITSCPGDIAYGTSKAGVAYITRQIAADYANDNIICNAVSPGIILTGRQDDAPDELLDNSNNRTPYPRLGKPKDVANAAVFLASDDCTFVTGEQLLVDGGWMAA